MLKYLVSVAVSLAFLGCTPSEHSLRNRVVKLVSERGSCSGEQVKAPSGRSYILTAGHCRVLANDQGMITVETESGKTLQRRVIEEDSKSDLLLIEGVPGLDGIDIAPFALRGTKIRTLTHGAGHATYLTEGELLETAHIQIMEKLSMEPITDCVGAKHQLITGEVFGIPINACILSVDETYTQAFIRPGSSGGMVVNERGELVGVVSAGDNSFGALVTLSDIHRFVGNY